MIRHLGAAAAAAVLCLAGAAPAMADGDLNKVNHIIIVMQENHSFDNYFGVLPYTPQSPYHMPKEAGGACTANDHRCIDGLFCRQPDGGGELACANANTDGDKVVHLFHNPTRCTDPDLNHSWLGSHQELSFGNPNRTLTAGRSNGFARVNAGAPGPSGVANQTMSYFDNRDIPLYYELAQKFAVSDRMFSSMIGPTIPNRFYLMAATSFGHLTTNDTVPPPGGYKPITKTIFDLMDENGVTWGDYFEDLPQSALFRTPDAHMRPLQTFMLQASGAGDPLPQVVFIDPNLGSTGTAMQDDEHPPVDIQRGQAHVSEVLNAIRNGPYWKDSIVFVTYDEHGGYYDHVTPPPARQANQRTPDGIHPGQCADLSNVPSSLQPGGGAECSSNFTSTTDTSLADAEALCPELADDPTGPYPAKCASFEQFGVRIPFIAISPFSKATYVSHTARDHTSMLNLIETRFMAGKPHNFLTQRDRHAASLEDMFDFANAPSLNTTFGSASPPEDDCTPVPKLP